MAKNEIKLRLDPYRSVNEITINGGAVSPYSTLNYFQKAPFLDWAYRFYSVVESEVNGDYSVTVMGEFFETKILENLSKNYPSCKNFRKTYFPVDMDSEDRVDEFVNLAMAYGNDPRVNKENIDIVKDPLLPNEELQALFDKYQGFKSFLGGATYISPLVEVRFTVTEQMSLGKTAVYIASSMSRAVEIAERIYPDGSQHMIFVLSDSTGLEWKNNCYYWKIKKNMLCHSLELYMTHRYIIPKLVSEISRQKLDERLMDEEDLEIYQMLLRVTPMEIEKRENPRPNEQPEPELEQKKEQEEEWHSNSEQNTILSLNLNKANLIMGQTQQVIVKAPNLGKSYSRDYYWESTNPQVAVVDIDGDGRNMIQSTGLGSCTLICKTADGSMQSSCDVSIESSLYRKDDKKNKLNISFFLSIIAVFLSLFGTPLSCILPSQEL